ncbi:hypothetical protein JFT81_28390 [Pseudomonas sp. TH43]|uniref:deaminase domain-containing protein n=1 Tax=Pseudomonas sp. TH43 TaxID=2796407 RepID=UPI001911886C|nr:deaminase domain-containing protein [Pseudomonas sp. TH43]MBK5378548.1 hypothetical protein [Pseudomonas sp. TH43]
MTLTSSTAPETAESVARQALGRDQVADIDALIARPTARDHKRYRSLLRAKPALAQSMSIDTYNAQRMDERIYETVKDFMKSSPLLIRRLASDVLYHPSSEDVRATPSVFLQRILDTAPSQDLTDRLLKTLKWYGALPGEKTTESVRYQLLCKAICLYLHKPLAEEPQALAGFDWQAPAHWGKSYQVLHDDFEQHVQRSLRAANTKEAIILARITRNRLSGDFAVADVPSELRYKSSVVWVNFMHGVLLAEALGLNRTQSLPFQALVNLPLQQSEGATPEQLEHIAGLRLGPALEWAVCMGFVEPRTASDYSEEDFVRAIKALETHSAGLNTAVMALEDPIPERLKMARHFIDDQFGSNALESLGQRFFPLDPPTSLSFRDMPNVKLTRYTFLDLYVDDQFENEKRWGVTAADGTTRTSTTLRIDNKRQCLLERKDAAGHYQPYFSGGFIANGKTLPNINVVFESAFNHYLTTATQAYKTLIASLMASLPLAERGTISQGDIEVLRLRIPLKQNGHPTDIRARKGFLLKVSKDDEISYYEVIPSAGLIRLRPGLRFSTIAGVRTEFPLHAVIPNQTYSPERNISTSLLIDDKAHFDGTTPAQKAYCIGYFDHVAHVPSADAVESGSQPAALTARLNDVADYIASTFLYVDEQQLRIDARGMSAFDILRAESENRLEMLVTIIKGFVPFWGSFDDLQAENANSNVLGGVGLLLDLASFLCPIGKFMSGSIRLIKTATGTARVTVKASLPTFSTLTRKLLLSSVKNLNPLDGIPSLLKGVGKGLLIAGRAGASGIRTLSAVANFRLFHNLPQAIDPGHWKALTVNDQLATINGIDDVLVRHTRSTDLKRLHLVDPATSLPYGPRLHNNRQLILGRSTFKALPPTENHALAALPEHARVREIFEVDGRTTLLVDDIPYRLDGDHLRRADLIDDQPLYKALPCRVKRAGDDLCQTRYVTREPAPTPAVGSFDESKGWAPWFGDSIYTPAIAAQPLRLKTLKVKNQHPATLAFQKGIYARINVEIPLGARNRVDTLETGAIIVPAIDGSKHYVFTRLDAGDFFFADLPPGQSLSTPLTLRKADSLPTDLRDELTTVYTGSLNANNMARIYGTAAVERALKAMEELAIPIGGLTHPPDTLRLIKVDTSPGEAVLFDHSTRMIVRHSSDGAATWSLSRAAPDSIRQTTARVFNALFEETVITVDSAAGGAKALKIDNTMQQLQHLISHRTGNKLHSPRNIAFAEISTQSGTREVYVSVSGQQGDTAFLPLFARHKDSAQVTLGDTTYINIDHASRFSATSLSVSDSGKIRAIPHTIDNIETYSPALTSRPTSLDTESKLIRVIRGKYPDAQTLDSITIATTMAPCDSCAVVMKQFGYEGGPEAMNVLWK